MTQGARCSCRVLGRLMLSFLSPLFLVGAAAAAVPIVLHLLKREPEARVKFAAVRLLRHGAGRAHAAPALDELLLLPAARRRAAAAGARVRASVLLVGRRVALGRR